MRKLILSILLSFSLFAQESYYQYVLEQPLGQFFQQKLFDLLSRGKYLVYSETVVLDKQAKKENGKIHYPKGWLNVKFYKPKGVIVKIFIGCKPSTTLRVNLKFRGDENQIFDYVNPSQVVTNQFYLEEKDIYFSNQSKGIAVRIANAGRILLADPEKSGWIYIGIVEDSVSWYSEARDTKKSYIEFGYDLKIVDEKLFLEWLSTQDFNYKGLGNPVAETDKLIVIPDEGKEDIVSFIPQDPGKFSIKKSMDIQGYFIPVLDENGNVGSYDYFYLSAENKNLYKLKNIDYEKKEFQWIKKNIYDCFTTIELRDDKVYFGSLKDQCDAKDVNRSFLERAQNRSFNIQKFIYYGSKPDEWLLLTQKNVYKLNFELGNLWKNVTRCFSGFEVKDKKAEFEANITSLDQEECFALDSKIFTGIEVKPLATQQPSEEVVEQSVSSESVSSSVAAQEEWSFLEEIATEELSFNNIDGVVKETQNGLYEVDITNGRLYLFKEIATDTFKRYDITECFSSIKIGEQNVTIGEFDRDNCSIQSYSSSSYSQSSSGSVLPTPPESDAGVGGANSPHAF